MGYHVGSFNQMRIYDSERPRPAISEASNSFAHYNLAESGLFSSKELLGLILEEILINLITKFRCYDIVLVFMITFILKLRYIFLI